MFILLMGVRSWVSGKYNFYLKNIPSDGDFFRWDYVTNTTFKYSDAIGAGSTIFTLGSSFFAFTNPMYLIPVAFGFAFGLGTLAFSQYVSSHRERVKKKLYYKDDDFRSLEEHVVTVTDRLESLENKLSGVEKAVNHASAYDKMKSLGQVDLTEYFNNYFNK